MSISQLLRGPPVQFPGEATAAQASPPAICERSRCIQLEAHRQEEFSQGLQPGRRVHRLWFKDTGIEELLQALQSCSVHGEAHSGGQPAPTVTSFSRSAFRRPGVSRVRLEGLTGKVLVSSCLNGGGTSQLNPSTPRVSLGRRE